MVKLINEVTCWCGRKVIVKPEAIPGIRTRWHWCPVHGLLVNFPTLERLLNALQQGLDSGMWPPEIEQLLKDVRNEPTYHNSSN